MAEKATNESLAKQKQGALVPVFMEAVRANN